MSVLDQLGRNGLGKRAQGIINTVPAIPNFRAEPMKAPIVDGLDNPMNQSPVFNQPLTMATDAPARPQMRGRGQDPRQFGEMERGALASKTLNKIKENPQITRDRGFMDGVRKLFGDERKMLGLAMAFNSMRYKPDAQLGQFLGDQLQGIRKTEQDDITKTRTIAVLRQKGRNDLADAMESGMLDPKTAAQLLFAQEKDERTALQKNFEFAQSQGYKGSFEDFLKARSQGTNINLGDTKTAKPQPGTQTKVIDGVTVQIPLFGSEAANQLETAVDKAKGSLDVISQALTDEIGLKAAVGAFDGRTPDFSPDAKRYATIHNQLKGQAFLAAFESLKGGGQITEIEGQKAEQAINRLDRAMSEEDYKAALSDLKEVMELALKRSQERWDRVEKPAGYEDTDPANLGI